MQLAPPPAWHPDRPPCRPGSWLQRPPLPRGRRPRGAAGAPRASRASSPACAPRPTPGGARGRGARNGRSATSNTHACKVACPQAPALRGLLRLPAVHHLHPQSTLLPPTCTEAAGSEASASPACSTSCATLPKSLDRAATMEPCSLGVDAVVSMRMQPRRPKTRRDNGACPPPYHAQPGIVPQRPPSPGRPPGRASPPAGGSAPPGPRWGPASENATQSSVTRVTGQLRRCRKCAT